MASFFPDPRPRVTSQDEFRSDGDGPGTPWGQLDDDEHDAAPAPQPDEDVVPGVVADTIVLASSPAGAAFLTAVRAYPNGLLVLLEVRARPGTESLTHVHGEAIWEDEYRAGRLKWGVELADGRRATNLDDPGARPHSAGTSASLVARGGSSSDRAVEVEYWLCPLPPAGTVTFACEWLDRAIPFTTQTLDAELFRSAARRSYPLWP